MKKILNNNTKHISIIFGGIYICVLLFLALFHHHSNVKISDKDCFSKIKFEKKLDFDSCLYCHFTHELNFEVVDFFKLKINYLSLLFSKFYFNLIDFQHSQFKLTLLRGPPTFY